MRNILVTLAKIHYEFGFIGYDEFNERVRIALWLSDEEKEYLSDPRIESEEDLIPAKSEDSECNDSVIAKIKDSKEAQKNIDEIWIEFLCLGLWVFTKADPDSYPSVPHGHYKSQNKKWPKLNPYTGRVFKSKHQEDGNKRLTKKQMKIIWTDEKFKSFCREMLFGIKNNFQIMIFL